MRSRIHSLLGVAVALVVLATGASAKEVVPLLGGLLIDGYDFQNDIGPKGSIAFDEKTGEFIGAYNALTAATRSSASHPKRPGSWMATRRCCNNPRSRRAATFRRS